MKKHYTFCNIFITFFLLFILSTQVKSQVCSTFVATYLATESRCASTGTIQISATGGSGNYQYKVNGPVNTNYTSNSLIMGLTAGRYLVTVKDLTTNCIYNGDSVTVGGNYTTPNFTMVQTPVTCINGNNGKITVTGTTNGRGPFSYKIVAPSASNVGLISPTGQFTNLLYGNYLIQLTDSCGAIQTRSITVDNFLWFINTHTVTKVGCDSINVTINLKDDKNNVTPHAVFNGFKYGASKAPGDTTWYTTNTFRYYKANKRQVTLLAKDGCGNIKFVIWIDPSVPNVAATVSISNMACSTFRATITGQSNLTNPNYCLYNSSNVLVTCNTTGVFSGVPYGSYCIKITDNCYDTTITRCFAVNRPVPSIATNVNVLRNCNSFTVTITGQTNVNNPNYCLYDANNILINCNTTGVFSNLPFGSYCIRMTNNPACYDTTITRCFTVTRPVPFLGPLVAISNKTCSTFTATINDTANWNNPQFCLYTPARVLIVCNTTGVFNNLPYDTYCIDLINNPICYDTTITRCFTVTRPIPSIDASVNISNKTCLTFTAKITGQLNVTNPQYCLYDNSNVLISCNTTGTFPNIAYGSYCIKMQNDATCFDTLITRCFSTSPINVNIDLNAKKSCTTFGTTDLVVDINSGTPAYTLRLYSPTGALLQTASTATNQYTFISLPPLFGSQKYKVVVIDQCGQKDSTTKTPNISIFNKIRNVTSRCPSATWPYGSGDININVNDNNLGGTITCKAIKKNGAVINISPTTTTGYLFSFSDFGPATYIFDTYVQTCNKHIYDTIVVNNYIFPDLYGSKVYRCDNSSFKVNVHTLHGIAPYMYEIFGSVPNTPSIITPPQSSPNFTINNGAQYSLIRLRVVDGCGNASLHDANILPLSNFLVYTDTLECFNHKLTLRVDSVESATYTWYKRIVPNDSVIVGTGYTYVIPMLTPADTGRYFCKISINNGCIIKYAGYVITGWCGTVLPNNLTLYADKLSDGNKLYWDATKVNAKSIELQRSSNNDFNFETIESRFNVFNAQASYKDKNFFSANNYYRLKIITNNNELKYSNIVLINNDLDVSNIMLYPNPVNEILYIAISNKTNQNYAVEIRTLLGELVFYTNYTKIQNAVLKIPRSTNIVSGIHLLKIYNQSSNEEKAFKVIYK